jgi:hypothetical protein
MQQRRPRLGDIVDDYCPRERRITNHAIVAMIEDEVKQTRCTTCDADHEYKQARIPAQRRRKDAPPALLGDAPATAPRRRPLADAVEPSDTDEFAPVEMDEAEPTPQEEEVTLHADEAPAPEPPPGDAEADEPHPAGDDEGPVHRRLIRATLPRPEGQVPERKAPEFTMHQREANGNRTGRARRGPRPGQMRTQGGGGANTRFGGQRQGPPRHGSGQGGPRPSGSGQGGGQGDRQPGQQRHNRHGGGRKRGR